MRVDGRVGPVTWKALRQVHLNKLESELMLGTVRDHPAPPPPHFAIARILPLADALHHVPSLLRLRPPALPPMLCPSVLSYDDHHRTSP